jgi:hypothetical protein
MILSQAFVQIDSKMLVRQIASRARLPTFSKFSAAPSFTRCRSFATADRDWAEELRAFRRKQIEKERASLYKDEVQKEAKLEFGKMTTATDEESKFKHENDLFAWRESISDETEKRQAELQMFAYPESKAIPYATISLLLLAGAVTAAMAGLQYKSKNSDSAMDTARYCSQFTKWSERLALYGRCFSVPHLFGASFWRDDRLATGLMHATIFGIAGTILEKSYGPLYVLGAAIGGSVVTNALLYNALPKLPAGSDELPIIGTTGGVSVVVGYIAFKYGRWAILPGVPIPCYWLLAPLFARMIHQSTHAFSTARQLRLNREAAALGEDLTEINEYEEDDENTVLSAEQLLAAAQKRAELAKEEVKEHRSVRQIYDILLAHSLQPNMSAADDSSYNMGKFLLDDDDDDERADKSSRGFSNDHSLTKAEMEKRQIEIETLEREFSMRHPGDWSFLCDIWALAFAFVLGRYGRQIRRSFTFRYKTMGYQI